MSDVTLFVLFLIAFTLQDIYIDMGRNKTRGERYLKTALTFVLAYAGWPSLSGLSPKSRHS